MESFQGWFGYLERTVQFESWRECLHSRICLGAIDCGFLSCGWQRQKFTIRDSAGDGICDPGYCEVRVDG
jgi:hypothetical protein